MKIIYHIILVLVITNSRLSSQPLPSSPLPDTITHFKSYREIYEFNTDKTIKNIKTYWYWPDSLPYTRFGFGLINTYDNDKKIKEDYVIKNENDLIGQLRKTYVYNKQGLDSIITHYNFQYNAWIGNKIYTYEYDSSNRLIYKKETNSNTTATYPVSIENWQYNSLGQLIKNASETYNNETAVLINKSRTEYEYDSLGLKVKTNQYWDAVANDWVNGFKYEYKYPNKDSLCYIEQWFNFNPQTQMWVKLNANKEFKLGDLIETETFRQRSDYYDWQVTRLYNAKKQLLSDERRELCPTLSIYKIREKKVTNYNSDGSLHAYDEYAGKGCNVIDSTLILQPRITYGYKKAASANEEIKYIPVIDIYPNPASYDVNIESKESEMNSITLMDNMGATLKKYYPSSHQFNIARNEFSAGLYFLRIQTVKGVVTKSILFH
jgi:hypothetical protein